MTDVASVIQMTADKWFLSEPLLFAAYCGHTVTENRNMMCAMRSGQRRIEYNPDWLKGLRELEIMELLTREVIRIILKHPYDRQPVNPIPELLYLASNLTIYMHGGTSIMPGMDLSTIPQNKRLSFEEYYNALLHAYVTPQAKSRGKGDNGMPVPDNSSEEGNDNSGGSEGDTQKEDGSGNSDECTENPNDGNSGEKRPQSLNEINDQGYDATALWEEDAIQMDYINRCIENAMLSRQWGSLPGNIQGLIKASTIKADNIRRRLDMFRTSIISTSRRLTRMRPSRRYGWTQMGVLHPYVSRLLIAVDTSGSVNEKDLVRFFGVINSFFTYGIPFIDVIQFDATVHMPLLSLKKVTSKIQLRGRGGTNFQAPVDFFTEHKEYDGMIVFTDGYAPIPKVPPHRKILWVLEDIQCYKEFEMTPKVYL